jgi:D-glycero-D-manno-heptose 1,7-bisphosphate phosphatase
MARIGTNNFQEIAYVFLDRDGVLNSKFADVGYISRWEQMNILPGVEQAIAQLNASGRTVIVVTNQRGIAKGLCSEAGLLELHNRLRDHLVAHGAHLDAIYYCPHDDGECNCRKPLPGMFEQAFRDFPGADAQNSLMIGDSLADIEAGARLGMRTVLITDRANLTPELLRAAGLATATAASLLACVQQYLGSERDS